MISPADVFKFHCGHGAVDVLSTSHKKLGHSDLSGTSTRWFVLSGHLAANGELMRRNHNPTPQCRPQWRFWTYMAALCLSATSACDVD